MISLATFDDDVMIKIFSTILQWYFIKGKFSTDVAKQENKIVTATTNSRSSKNAAAINAIAAHNKIPLTPEYTSVYTTVRISTQIEII